MFRFEQAEILWLLLTIPLLIFLFSYYLRSKKTKISKAGNYELLRRLFSDWSHNKEWLKFSLFTFALTCMVIAWSNPQWGSKKENVNAKSADVIIALDISQSMLAEDVSPNRMERAKRFVTRLINSLKGERIGLIYFAGSAYLQMPLSNDYASAELYIKSASPAQAGTQGTVIADAIEMSMETFGTDGPTQKALIIISDGENHDEEAIEAARAAREKGTFIYTVGIGSDEGAYIPVYERGQRFYKKDNQGQPVKTTLNKDLLNDIAKAGGGAFYMIDNSMSPVQNLKSEINKLEKQEVQHRSFTDYNSYFQYFLIAALLLIILESLTSNFTKRRGIWKRYLGIE